MSTQNAILRIAVESSSIASIGYEPETATLIVEFRTGALYEYPGVSPEIHHAFLAAESKGAHFNRFIKGRFAFAKIGEGHLTQ